jgi:sulfoxide reductase heme-binding subunit YedZ
MKKRLQWLLVFVACAMPSIYFFATYLFDSRALGIDPVETLLAESGQWSLRFLLGSLACSPLRRAGLKTVARFRRMLGLYAFYYASLHLLIYVFGWIQLDWSVFVEDVVSRPFIYLGMITWLVLTVLAATSPKVMIKKLKKRWVLIHRFVYLAAIGGIVHLWMQSRGSYEEVVLYGTCLTALLVERLYRRFIPRFMARKSTI